MWRMWKRGSERQERIGVEQERRWRRESRGGGGGGVVENGGKRGDEGYLDVSTHSKLNYYRDYNNFL